MKDLLEREQAFALKELGAIEPKVEAEEG